MARPCIREARRSAWLGVRAAHAATTGSSGSAWARWWRATTAVPASTRTVVASRAEM